MSTYVKACLHIYGDVRACMYVYLTFVEKLPFFITFYLSF